jgi:hypothetical protein
VDGRNIKILTLHKTLIKPKSAVATHMRTGRIGLADYLFSSSGIHSAVIEVHLWISRTDAHAYIALLRSDIAKRLKASVNCLMRINLLTQFSLAGKCVA